MLAWTIFVEDHQRILKLIQWMLTKIFIKFFFFWLPWQPKSFMDSKFLNNFQSVTPLGQSCEIWLKLDQQLRRGCCLKKLWMDKQTDNDNDEWWVITIAPFEPSGQVSYKAQPNFWENRINISKCCHAMMKEAMNMWYKLSTLNLLSAF